MGFQKQVNLTPAPAVAGDFASSNPRATVLAGPGGLVAGALGVTVGKFAWVDDNGATVQSFGTATKAPDGFVHREQQALIQAYLAESSMNVPQGFPVVLHNEGDFWAKLAGDNAATIGAAIYADYSNGDVCAVAAPAGTPGGAGVYVTSAATTISAATATSFGNRLNVTAVGSGVLEVGDAVSGTGIPSGAVVASQVSGTAGGVGVYTLDLPATAYAASTTVTAAGGVLTAFKAKSAAAVGELVKISTWG